MGCTDPLGRGVGAPHQCPLESVASYLIYADVFANSILMVLWHFKGTIDMSASGLAVDATITPGMTSTHEPSLAINGCNTNIGALDIKFHGGVSAVW